MCWLQIKWNKPDSKMAGDSAFLSIPYTGKPRPSQFSLGTADTFTTEVAYY